MKISTLYENSVICTGVSVDKINFIEKDIVINFKNAWYYIIEILENMVTLDEIVKINKLISERDVISSIKEMGLGRKKEREKNIKIF